MTNKPLLNNNDKERLQHLLDCYGAYEHHWPEDSRGWVLGILETYEEARILRKEISEIDHLLDLSPAEPDVSVLMDNVLSLAPKAASSPSKGFSFNQWWPYESFWRPLSALTTAGAFGLLLGTTSPDFIYLQDSTEIQEAYLAFSSGNSLSSDFLEGEIN